MASSLWLQVVQALAGRLTAQPGYRHPESEDPGVAVYALQEVDHHEDPTAGNWVCIGWTGTPDDRTVPGAVEQRTATLGNRARDELGEVAVRVCAQTGDADPQTATSTAMARLADLERLLRDDPTIGVPARRMVAQIGSVVVLPADAAGSLCYVDATVTYSARI